jgi:flagellar assembly factor FliW
MPTIRTKQFGSIDYDDADIFEFPAGLPGFESEQRFLCIERPALRPVAFLQSVVNPELCFITLPARSVDPGYELAIAPDELQILGVAQPEVQSVESSLACLAIVCLNNDGPPTANLLGPVVLSRETRRGIQSVRDDRKYSAVTPVAADAETSEPAGVASPNAVSVNHLAEV